MNPKQAKDFFVQQVTRQAALENLSLSNLERRMMYFTESDPSSCEEPIELNDEFEAQYNTVEYEAKISSLLQHAYDRLREPETKLEWDQAIGELRKGDHYLLVLLDQKPRVSFLLKTAWKELLMLVGHRRR